MTREEEVVKKIRERRVKNGTHPAAIPDTYERMLLESVGIEIDHMPGKDDGEPPVAWEDMPAYEACHNDGHPYYGEFKAEYRGQLEGKE